MLIILKRLGTTRKQKVGVTYIRKGQVLHAKVKVG